MPGFDKIFTDQIVVLDGGLGTTLEELCNRDISHTPLWSAQPIDEEPETITAVHSSFLLAGSRLILTSTYQCSFSTFEQAGYTRDDARKVMIKSVRLANEAKELFYNKRQDVAQTDVRVALSLGPFGATLSPAQEFDGFYPPPYGPKGYAGKQDNINAFERVGDADEKAEEALAQFHFERLLVFASEREVWDGIDCLAFETVPLAREIRAIRRALKMLEDHEQVAMKPSWICFVFPDGRYPETDGPKGPPLTVQQVVRAALEQGVGGHGRVPDAIGINCTRVEFLPELLVQLEQAVESICTDSISKPWLVVYPNGGDVYDPVSRKWIAAEKPIKARTWARDLALVVQRAQMGKAWGGIIVGGCCRTGPLEIEEVARLVGNKLT